MTATTELPSYTLSKKKGLSLILEEEESASRTCTMRFVSALNDFNVIGVLILMTTHCYTCWSYYLIYIYLYERFLCTEHFYKHTV